MKKTLLLLSFIAMLSHKNQAQISIGKEDLPIPGTFAGFGNAEGTSFTLPAIGAQKTWSYANFQEGDTSLITFSAASANPYSNKFPDATLVVEGEEEAGKTYAFYKEGTNGLYAIGFYETSSDSTVRLKRPQLLYAAPISFGQTVKDSSRLVFSGVDEGITVTHSQFTRETVVGEGYGIITTPAGTFNTLLVKFTTYSYDTTTFFISPLPAQTETSGDTSISYFWVQKNKNLPIVFDMSLSNTGDKVIDASYYSLEIPTGIAITPNTDFSRQYPVPADKSLIVELKKAQEGVFTLYAMNGIVKNTFRMSFTNKIEVPTAAVEGGMYFYEIKFDDGTSVKNKIIVSH